MKKTLIVVGAGIGVLALVKFVQISRAIAEHSKFKPPPEAITTTIAKEENWQRTLSAVGSLSPSQGVTLKAEEGGRVAKIGFESGTTVLAGAVLVELDTSVEEANLKGALARADKANKELVRMKSLRASQAMSQSSLDAAAAEAAQTEAEVASLQAQIARKRIVAPFSGRAGIRMVNVGQYLSPGTEVVPLHAMDPIYMNFSLPQQVINDVKVGQKVSLTVDAFPELIFDGQLSALNPQVEIDTRNFELQATFKNSDERLRPGMFATITVQLEASDKVIPLPATSINYAPYGDTAYVVTTQKDPQGQEYKGAEPRIVHLGLRRGDQIAVLGGIKAGDEVVTSGVFKLRPGAAVLVNNALLPSNDPQAKPNNS